MNVRWFKIKSWHIYNQVSRGNVPLSACGRWGALAGGVIAEIVDDRPANEKSCETCLRLRGPK